MTELVEDIDRGWKRIKRDMATSKRVNLVVDVGITGSKAEEPHGGTDLTNADIGLFHEFGTNKSPERSFIRALIDVKHQQINRLFERIARGIIDGKVSEKRGLGLAGEEVVSWIKARIRAHIPPPLAPETIEAKGSSTPLIDESQLMGSITHAVRGASQGDR